jgi:hypothetical protein
MLESQYPFCSTEFKNEYSKSTFSRGGYGDTNELRNNIPILIAIIEHGKKNLGIDFLTARTKISVMIKQTFKISKKLLP